MAVRVSVVIYAFAIFCGVVSADYEWFHLNNGNDAPLIRHRRQAEGFTPNVVECVNPCIIPETTPEIITTEEWGSTTTEDLTTTTTEEIITPTSTEEVIISTTETTINPITPEIDVDVCSCTNEQFNLRLSYLFMLNQNFDQRTSYVFNLAIYNALNSTNTDRLSSSLRIILGLEQGDLMLAISDYQEDMSWMLTRHVKITTSLKHIFQGQISTSEGIEVLYSRFPASRKINKNNAILIEIAALLLVNTGANPQQSQELWSIIQNSMPQTAETEFFLKVTYVVWALQVRVDNEVACGRLYYTIQTNTVNVIFGREIEFNEYNKDCDDSEDDSDASDLENDDEVDTVEDEDIDFEDNGGEESDEDSDSDSSSSSDSDSDSDSDSKENKRPRSRDVAQKSKTAQAKSKNAPVASKSKVQSKAASKAKNAKSKSKNAKSKSKNAKSKSKSAKSKSKNAKSKSKAQSKN